MSIQALGEQQWKIRWREGGHQRSLSVCGPYELAKKIERKKLSLRDENRHLDVKQEVYFPMSTLLQERGDEGRKICEALDELTIDTLESLRERSVFRWVEGWDNPRLRRSIQQLFWKVARLSKPVKS